MTGDGSDETFAISLGYILGLSARLRFRKLYREVFSPLRYTAVGWKVEARYLAPYLAPKIVHRLWRLLKWRKPPAWVNPEFARRTELLRRLRSPFPYAALRDTQDYFLLTRPRAVLRKEERDISAAHWGLEMRYPFLDLRLVEYLLAVPQEVKLCRGRAKSFLRDTPGLLPPAVRDLEKKADYQNIHETFLREGAGVALGELFRSPPPEAAQYLDLTATQHACERFLRGDNRAELLARNLACFYLWIRGTSTESSSFAPNKAGEAGA